MPSCRSTWGCQEPGVDCTKESIEQGWFLWQYLKISLLAYRSLPFITFVSELVLVFVSQLQIILDEKINYVDKISKNLHPVSSLCLGSPDLRLHQTRLQCQILLSRHN